MAGLQDIINNANGLSIDRRKIVGIQYTRNEIPRVSQTPTKNPWKLTLDMPNSYRYSEARALMEALDKLDRTTPEIITFGDNPALSWIFRYQGSLNSGQLNNIYVVSYVGDQLTLAGLPTTLNPATSAFKANDLIQIDTYPYPFTVVNDVAVGSVGSIIVTTSRPNILTGSLTGYGITVGNSCQFKMFCPNMPTYKLIVGGQAYSGSTLINNALIEWSDSFQLYEFVGTA